MMKAVVVEKLVKKYTDGKEALEECLVVKQVPLPVPRFNQVLVKVQRAQINPSDTSFVQGRYGKKCEPGMVPGFECCGTVVGHGGSPAAWWLMGKRVSVFGSGCWAEYVVSDALQCFDIGSNTPWSSGAGAVVNPMTVVTMCSIAKNEKFVVATAGSSSLTGQFIRAAKSRGISTIAIVRKPEQVEECQQLGAFDTLDSSDEEAFDAKLKAVCKEHNVRLAFDSVAGEVGSKVFAALATGGEMHVYGFLSGKPVSVTGADLIFKQKVLKGLWLGKNTSTLQLMMMRREVIAGLNSDLTTKVRATFRLENVVTALLEYTSHLSGGKVHLIIGDEEDAVVEVT